MNLLFVLPVSNVDYDLALKLFAWMRELGGLPPQTILLVADCKLSKERQRTLYKEACSLSEGAEAMVATHFQTEDRWPISPNALWLNAARHIEAKLRRPWLWLEADAVPLRRGWLESLQAEYDACDKPFMGVLLKSTVVFGKLWPIHMAGVGIYPADAATRVAPLVLERAKEAWDILSGQIVGPQMHHTRQIIHVWGTRKEPPTFVQFRSKGCASNVLTLDQIPSDAAVFHRVKDPSLVNLLRDGGMNRFSSAGELNQFNQ